MKRILRLPVTYSILPAETTDARAHVARRALMRHLSPADGRAQCAVRRGLSQRLRPTFCAA